MRGMLAANFRAQPNHLIPVCHERGSPKGHRPERKTGVFARAHDTIEESVRRREELKDNLKTRRLLIAKFKLLALSW